MLAVPAMTLIISGPDYPSLIVTRNDPSLPDVAAAQLASASGAPLTMRQARTLACFTSPLDTVPPIVVGAGVEGIDIPPESPPPLHAESVSRTAAGTPNRVTNFRALLMIFSILNISDG